MLTPPVYWRVAVSDNSQPPLANFSPPQALASQGKPPKKGDGIILAGYDNQAKTGLIEHLGLITAGQGASVTVDWKPVKAEIWVDTPAGRGNWAGKPGFAFAPAKVAGYGLHNLFADNFEGLEIRAHEPGITRPKGEPKGAAKTSRSHIAPERLIPMEVIGEPTTGSRAGVVYVLKSALGYKVGRTRNVPARMRAFGVHLPFIYTIPLCAWFDDCVDAEGRYHSLFRDKHINGEWFDLTDTDVDLVRQRSFAQSSASLQ